MTGFDDWKSLLVNFLSEDEGEVKLKLARDETSIILSTDNGKEPIKLHLGADENLEIRAGQTVSETISREKFLDVIEEEFEEDLPSSTREKDLGYKSLVKTLLKVKSSP